MNLTLRKAHFTDLDPLIRVENGSTPNLSYIPDVFEQFVTDPHGEFIVAELDGEIAACGKFTIVPGGSAWLETLRVLPQFQGLGIGKRIYERFFELAKENAVQTMRMYTGVTNFVSKGLAERYGFHLAGTFRGAYLPCQPGALSIKSASFQPVVDPQEACRLLMPHAASWAGFLVMNRTFYALEPALCAHLAQRGQVFHDPSSGSLVVLGARFMPRQALHIGLFQGDSQACLGFALQTGLHRRVERLSCLFPSSNTHLASTLAGLGFQFEKSDFIVMEVRLP